MSIGNVFSTYAGGGSSSVQSGTKAQMFATTGSASSPLFYNTTYNALFTWANDRWWPVDPDPRYGFLFAHEEFTGADRIGTLDWSGNNGQVAGNLLNQGQVTISNSTASSIQRMSMQLNSIQLGTCDMWLETILQIPTLSNGTDNACFYFGLNDGSAFSATSACTDGVFFTLDPTDTHWLTNTTSNSANTAKTSTTTPAAATYYRLSIFIEAATQATFYVNGTAITAAHTTNLPTGAGRQTGIAYGVNKTLGSGALSMTVDSFDGWAFYNGQRVA